MNYKNTAEAEGVEKCEEIEHLLLNDFLIWILLIRRRDVDIACELMGVILNLNHGE